MTLIQLSSFDLALASSLIVFIALLSLLLQLGLEKQILIGGLRAIIQLTLIGLVLKTLFAYVNLYLLLSVSFIMLLVAGREVAMRQKRYFKGIWGIGIGGISMFVAAFSILLLGLTVIIKVEPWYTPQYFIPLLGMTLGNTMNGIALGMDRLSQTAWQQKAIIESRLMLGQTWSEAIFDIRKDCIRGGMIPIINTMAIVGVVSLPGMMTGQILAGSPPVEAVKYQILIIFMIAASVSLGTILAVWLGSRRLFDERQRLRLDRLALRKN